MSTPEHEPFHAYPAALELGIQFRRTDTISPHEGAIHVLNGRMPRGGGLYESPNGELGALDFVGVDMMPKGDVMVHPLPKSLVDDGSKHIVGGGMVVMAGAERIRPAYEVQPWERAQWDGRFRQAGHVGVRHLFGGPELEIVSIDKVTGGIVAKPPRRFWAFSDAEF